MPCFGWAAQEEEDDDSLGERTMRYAYFGNSFKLSALPVHAEMLAATFSLPAHMVIDVLQLVQSSLQALFSAPPQARFLFEPEGGFEALRERLASSSVEAAPTGSELIEDHEDDDAPQNKFRLERRKKNIEGEAQLARGEAAGLLTDEQVPLARRTAPVALELVDTLKQLQASTKGHGQSLHTPPHHTPLTRRCRLRKRPLSRSLGPRVVGRTTRTSRSSTI